MNKGNPYDVLGIPMGTPYSEARKKYLQELKKANNLTGSAREARVMELNMAIEEIKTGYNPTRQSTHEGGSVNSRNYQNWENINDFFSNFFNPMSGFENFQKAYNRRERRKRVEVIEISFEKAYTGGEITVEIITKERCPNCYQKLICPQCGGSGIKYRNFKGLTVEETCDRCNGSGKVSNSCNRCREGIISETKKINLQIPAGVVDNQLFEYNYQGKVGVLQIKILDSDKYNRIDDDLIVREYVTLREFQGGIKKIFDIFGNKHVVNLGEITRIPYKHVIPGQGYPSGFKRGDIVLIIGLDKD